MAIVPTLAAIGAIAPAAGRLAGATQLFGPEQRERLAELEEPGITRTAQEQVAGYGQSLLAPILQSQQEQQQGLAQALTPAAAGGALGATARGFQGAEQRMARATEMPMMKIEEKRRKAELKEEKEQDELDTYRRSRRQQMLKETFAIIGAAAKAGQAFEAWSGQHRFWGEEQGRMKKSLGIDGDQDLSQKDIQSAAKRAGLEDRFTASTVRWAEGAKPAASSVPAVVTESETAAALQAIGGPAAEPGFEFEAAAPTAPPPPRYALEGVAVAPGSRQAFVKDAETGEVISVDEAYRRVQESRTGGRRRGR